jgi:tetratricopeptide (TPR) repeat protein
MPKRVNQHEIEDISRAKFQLALPRKWVFRDKTKDYGIDGEVELFDNNKAPQGLVFWVQLKATESKEKSAILNIDFSIETLRYYKTLDIPVLLVRYSDSDNSIYIKWIHNIDLFFAKEDAKTFRIKLTKKDKWVDLTNSQIEKYLKKIRQLKSGSFSFPIPLSVLINETKINNISKGILLTQIKKNLQEYSDFVSISNDEDSFIIASLNNKELKINISELSGCSFHSIDLRKEDDFSICITKDILLGIAVGLIQLRQVEFSGKIIFENNLQSRLLEKPELLEFCLTPLFNSAFFENTLNLVGQVLDKEDFIGLNIITQINLLLASNSKNKTVSKAIENFLKTRLEKAIRSSDKRQIGISHYNIGNHLSGRSEFERSIHHYNLARKFAPIYLEQHYYFAEIASVLFRSGKYKMASKLYSKSIELKKDNHTLALYADSLMFEGNYKKAHTYFEEYLNNSESPIDEFVLKNICLASILNEYKIEQQNRNNEEANKYADFKQIVKGEDPIEQIEKALQFDMLSGLAWFNLGISHSDKNDYSEASFCFSMAALVNNEDIEAWKNATLCAFNSKETITILPLIIRTAYFFNSEEYLEEFYLHLENQNQSAPINQIIEAIEQILPEKVNKNTIPTVRLLNEKGRFESINEIIKGHNKV